MDVQPLGVGREAKRLERIGGRQPELRAVVARPDLLVRVGLDARGDTDQRPADARPARTFDLLERVEHHERPDGGSRPQLVVRLVVPVDDEALAADAGGQGEAQLAERRHVGADPLLGEEPHQRHVRERLGAVAHDRLGGSRAVGAGLGAQRGFVIDDERAAVRADEIGRGQPADDEVAALDGRGIGKQAKHTPILPAARRPFAD